MLTRANVALIIPLTQLPIAGGLVFRILDEETHLGRAVYEAGDIRRGAVVVRLIAAAARERLLSDDDDLLGHDIVLPTDQLESGVLAEGAATRS